MPHLRFTGIDANDGWVIGAPRGRTAEVLSAARSSTVVLKTGRQHSTVNAVTASDTHASPISADSDRPDDPTAAAAARFFWTVLVLATAASIGGNVTHAILKAGSGPLVMVAAAVAMVPPIVLLAGTHSVGLLVRTRSTGTIYWAALAITVCLSGCAFALSFDSLWELAVNAGVRRGIAWLWPLSIDMSIAQATLALLSLTRRRAQSAAAAVGETSAEGPASVVAPPVAVPAPAPQASGRGAQEVASLRGSRRATVVRAVAQLAPPIASATDWSDVAETLVRDGVTTKSVTEVVEALQLWEVGTAPNTIARRLGLHRDTVTKITGAAGDLLSAAKIRA